jgi:protein HOOK3
VLIHTKESIDPEAFSEDLPSKFDMNPSSEQPFDFLTNLNHIYKALTAYIVDRCRRKLPLPSGEPDLTAIAQSSSEKDVTQLLKLVLLAAIFGRFSMDYIQQLTSFSEEAQAQFYLILEEPVAIEEAQEAPPLQPDTSIIARDEKNKASLEKLEKDPELIYEERIAGLVAFNKELEHQTIELNEQLENLHDLHTKLQKSYDSLEVQHQDTTERLQALRSGKGEQNMLSIQRTKMQQQEDVIATLEGRVHSLQEENGGLKIQTDLLQSQTEGFQQMKDDVYELKVEREELQRKANAADKYKQKLQSLQRVEDENEALKYRVTELQRQLKQCDSDQFINSDLKRENDEFQRLVSNIERELSDSIEAKKRAEFEKMTLEAKLQQADDNATRWHTKTEELQALLNDRAGSESPTTPRAITADSLNITATADEEQQESKISEGVAELGVDDQNMITENELQAIISIMKAHTQHTSNAARTSSIQEQQKLAAKIENSRAITRALKQVIDNFTQPRVEFVGVKNLDEGSPYKPVSPHIDDLAATYGLASLSARSSVTSLSAASRRSSVASFHSSQSNTTPRRGSLLRGFFGSSGN